MQFPNDFYNNNIFTHNRKYTFIIDINHLKNIRQY